MLPVHDESMGDDHFVQIVLVMPGHTEEVQIVALLVVGDLEVKKQQQKQKKKKKNKTPVQLCAKVLTSNKDALEDKVRRQQQLALATLSLSTTCLFTHARVRTQTHSESKYGHAASCGMRRHRRDADCSGAGHLLSIKHGRHTLTKVAPPRWRIKRGTMKGGGGGGGPAPSAPLTCKYEAMALVRSVSAR